jgi:hypothetical protein
VSTPSSASAGIGDSADRELVTITGATPLVVPAPPRQELVTIIGAAGGAQAFAQSAAWQSVPRTEAAARSGMALYGIEGLDPLQTMIPADGAIVRTTYRLESGELVQLEQRRSALTDRVPASLQETVRARPAAPAAQSTVDTDADGTRTWSAVLGAARLTLRASSPSANLEMLAQRLRVD